MVPRTFHLKNSFTSDKFLFKKLLNVKFYAISDGVLLVAGASGNILKLWK